MVHVVVEQVLKVGPKLLDVGFIVCIAAAIHEGVLHNRVKGHAVDDLTRTFGDDQADGALKGEVHEEGDIIGAFFGGRQRRKNKESAPT